MDVHGSSLGGTESVERVAAPGGKDCPVARRVGRNSGHLAGQLNRPFRHRWRPATHITATVGVCPRRSGSHGPWLGRTRTAARSLRVGFGSLALLGDYIAVAGYVVRRVHIEGNQQVGPACSGKVVGGISYHPAVGFHQGGLWVAPVRWLGLGGTGLDKLVVLSQLVWFAPRRVHFLRPYGTVGRTASVQPSMFPCILLRVWPRRNLVQAGLHCNCSVIP